jgi:hypothetical protein
MRVHAAAGADGDVATSKSKSKPKSQRDTEAGTDDPVSNNKLVALRSAITAAIGPAANGATANGAAAYLPIPPLIDIITEYAIEDFTVTRLVGQIGNAGYVDN